MDDPDYLCELVVRGGLRKISCHIDITQAGRAGFPVKSLSNEAQLNGLRDRLVELVLDVRRRTGLPLNAAQTVTVTSRTVTSSPSTSSDATAAGLSSNGLGRI